MASPSLYSLLSISLTNGQELAATRSRSMRPCSMATASDTAEVKIADDAGIRSNQR